MYEQAILGWFLKPLPSGDCVKFKGQLKGFSAGRDKRGAGREGHNWQFICNHIFTGH